MSAVPLPVFEEAPQRGFPRHPIKVPLDVIALRSGVPETLPGRCTDISEAGVGAVVAGELAVGQQVAVELRLPDVGVPVRVRALVRYQARLRCGLEFSGLSVEQREMIRYWVYRSANPSAEFKQGSFDFKKESTGQTPTAELSVASPEKAFAAVRKVRIGRRGLYTALACILALAVLGWWQWQRSWNDLESQAQGVDSGLRVSSETMEKRILTKVEPEYPEAARKAGNQGLVVLDAVIAADGSVRNLRPVSGPALLVDAAARAVRSWKFEPYLSSGKPVEVETTIAIDFRLN
jgi:TonB family protein